MKLRFFKNSRALLTLFLITGILFPLNVLAQYFGRNKPQYKNLAFEVLQTPHYKLYHYLTNDSLSYGFAQQAERWYTLHQSVLKDTLKYRNPIILYENHADFQQTTVISGLIGEGTGGVTEGLKNRVVMPLMKSNSETVHVLGHELVHAFQYNLLKTGDSTSLYSTQNIPLWLIEGMAEYLSIGRIDPHTSMWMRDAVVHNDIPTLRQLGTDARYFPYRYGQAFWAFVGGTWSDTIIRPLFMETAMRGYEAAIQIVLGKDEKELSELWKNALKTHYEPYLRQSSSDFTGTKLISEKNAGKMNMSPAISPNGKYMVFLSEKDIFSIEPFLADAASGKIIRKLPGTFENNHIDAISFSESAGTWSPDSRKFAYIVYEAGKNKLIITDVISGRSSKTMEIRGVPAFSYPAWSPDGKKIVVSGFVKGQSDLFMYDLENASVKQLTNDPYADLQPSWSADGKYIAFASDRTTFGRTLTQTKGGFTISVLDIGSQTVENLDAFTGANNLNPEFSPDNTRIYFLSDRDGFRNLYHYDLANKKIYQMTRFATGITGITDLSSALSVAKQTGTITYSAYWKNSYEIYSAGATQFDVQEVHKDSLDFRAGTLPPYSPANDAVTIQVNNQWQIPVVPVALFKKVPYRPEFRLDYIGNATAGVAVSSFGTGMAGGVNMLFGDMLSNHQIFTGIAINGEIYDLAGQVAYLNQKHSIRYGVGYSHIPYPIAQIGIGSDTLQSEQGELIPVTNVALDVLRIFEDRVDLFAFYPTSQIRRFELGGSVSLYNYRLDRINNYYTSGYKIAEEKERLPAPKGYIIQEANVAYVGDNSFFGMTSPLKGHRFRYEVGQYFNAIRATTLLLDQRQYYFRRPFGLAVRGMHFARYGKDADSERLFPLFLGYPTLVRGYHGNALYRYQVNGEQDFFTDQLIGSRILVGNAEIRIPFTGPERLSLIKSGFLLTEWALFTDAGVAWTASSRPSFKTSSSSIRERTPVISSGIALRVNIFGYLVIEPYYAIPFQLTKGQKGVWGINFSPGW